MPSFLDLDPYCIPNLLNTTGNSLVKVCRQARENRINVIFAVTEDQADVYRYDVVPGLEGSSSGTLSKDRGSAVVRRVMAEYEAITTSVEVEDNAVSEFVRITYYSSCLAGGASRPEQTSVCSGGSREQAVGQIGYFPLSQASVSATACGSQPR